MPSPRKRAASAAATNKKKLTVKVAGIPPRQSTRIRANAEIKSEPASTDDEGSPKKKVVIKSKGKTVHIGSSMKSKSKNSTSSKKKTEAKHPQKMSVLAIAAARKRKLNGEDDEEPVRQKRPKKKVSKKKVIKKKPSPRKTLELESPEEMDEVNEAIGRDEEQVVEESFDDQPMVAVKHDEDNMKEDTAELYDEENDVNESEGEDDEEEEQHNLLISEEHQYIEQMQDHQIVEEDGEIEVPQEQVQAELQHQENEEDEDEQEDDEDIDENLFFGIPEQRSPELATCTHCKGKFRKEDVHEHMLTCPERYVQCRECGKILSNLQTLERHHKRFHLKIREVPCTLCDKMFIDEAAARKHLKTVHFKVKNFHCPHCDKSFSQRNKLTYHVRTHSGEKPYSCAECGRSFSLLWNLKTHLRTHTGEKPYACDTCGRRFTQKQNMTSHLTTHRKPKSDKSFRSHFPTDLDDYDTSPGIITSEFSSKPTNKNYRAFEQAKQLNAQSIGGAHYVLGDMQSIEVHTASDGDGEQQNVSLEHGLGLLSSVARKGDATDVQVDGIVNIPENQLINNGNNLDQVVEVLIRSNGETDNEGNPLTTVQLGQGNQTKIVIDPNTQSITDADGQEIPIDANTAAGLSSILQNPDVLAAINSAASTNKFIVIGPVSMFDGTNSQSSSVVLSTTASAVEADANATISHDQLREISALVQQGPDAVSTHISPQTVNDSISATSALAAVESYLQGEQPSSSISKGDDVVSNILGSIQPDGKRGPSAIVQSAQANLSRASNLTISMPPMSQNTLTISPTSLSINADSTQRIKTLPIHQNNASASSSEVSSSVDNVQIKHVEQISIQQGMEAESTTQPVEFSLSQENEAIAQAFAQSASTGAADSTGMDEASSSGEPILMLSTDENGQPQIIVKMPDGSETIMSDPALAESLIQVPTITNAVIEGVTNEAEPSQSIAIDQMGGSIELQMPDQGIPTVIELPSQSGMQQQFVSQSVESSEVNINERQQLPDQSLDSASALSNVDSSGNVELIKYSQQNLIESTDDQPDSSSQSYQRVVAENHIDSRQGIFVMEHVSASEPEQSDYSAEPGQSDFSVEPGQSGYSAEPEQSGYSAEPEQSNYAAEQRNIDFIEQENTEFTVDSSSSNRDKTVDSGDSYLQLGDVSQSTNSQVISIGPDSSQTENVSSTEQTDL